MGQGVVALKLHDDPISVRESEPSKYRCCDGESQESVNAEDRVVEMCALESSPMHVNHE